MLFGQREWLQFVQVLNKQGIDMNDIGTEDTLVVLMDEIWKDATKTEKTRARVYWSQVIHKKALTQADVPPLETPTPMSEPATATTDKDGGDIDDSASMLGAIVDGIDKAEANEMEPFLQAALALLSLEDDFHAKRVLVFVPPFIDTVVANAEFTRATLEAVNFIHKRLSRVRLAAEWLSSNRERWVQALLVSCSCDAVRELVIPIISEITGIRGDDDTTELPPAQHGELCSWLEFLLKMSPVAARNIHAVAVESDDEAENRSEWKIVPFIKAIRWCIRGKQQRGAFSKYACQFLSLLVTIDSKHHDIDVGKSLCQSLLVKVMKDSPELVRIVAADFSSQILAWHISIKPTTEYIDYNRPALQDYYTILEMLAEASPEFLAKLAGHANFDWAIHYLILDSSVYAAAAEVIFRLLVAVLEKPELAQRIRDKFIPIVARHKRINVNARLILLAAFVFVVSERDAMLFANNKGLSLVRRALDHELRSGAAPSPTVVRLAVDLTERALTWTLAPENVFRSAILSVKYGALKVAQHARLLAAAIRCAPSSCSNAASACRNLMRLLPPLPIVLLGIAEGLLTSPPPPPSRLAPGDAATEAQEPTRTGSSLAFSAFVRETCRTVLPSPAAVILGLALIASEPGGEEEMAQQLLALDREAIDDAIHQLDVGPIIASCKRGLGRHSLEIIAKVLPLPRLAQPAPREPDSD